MDSLPAAAEPTRRYLWIVPGLVLLTAALLAASFYVHFWGIARQLFHQIGEHDRNAHYWLALNMGRDLRAGDLPHFLYDIHKARSWPPLYNMLAGAAMAVGGIDFRLAVLPSLAAWVGTVFFGFLLARRAVPCGGDLAGVLAALLILSSPALKAYAVDIMIESLGACLTLAALYCYVRFAQQAAPVNGWLLALALTSLFFCKYNYYILVVLAVVLAELATRWADCLPWLERLRSSIGPLLRGELRQPLNYPIVLTLAVLGMVCWVGQIHVQLGGKTHTIQASGLLLELPYIFLFLRLLLWWRRQGGRQICAGLPDFVRPLVHGHAMPVLFWFLWPQRLSYFLWYTAAPHGATPEATWTNGVVYYWHCLLRDYQWNGFSLLIVIPLLAAVLLGRRWLRPGGQVVLWFVLLAAVLTAKHPNQKSRNMHSWVAGVWVAAGMGLAYLAHGRSRGQLRPWLGTAAAAGVGVLLWPGITDRGRAPEGGPYAYDTGAMDVFDWYVPYLGGSERAAVLSNVPIRFQAMWTSLEQHGPRPRIESAVEGVGAETPRPAACLKEWLASTPNDTLVFMDVLPRSVSWIDWPESRAYQLLRDLLPAQDRFTLKGEHWFPSQRCRVSVWSRQ